MIRLHTTTEGKIKTKIYIRGFNTDFEIDVWRKKPITIEYAEWWAQSQIINTAMVKGVTHYFPEGELYIRNEKYKEPVTTIKKPNNGKN